MNISEHFSYEEATFSATAKRLGIENIPNADELAFMKVLAETCLEPLRRWYGPIRVNSYFRCKELNKAVGSKDSSQHRKGQAADITGGNKVENKKIFDWCKANLKFDQLIFEYGDDTGPEWVHISFHLGNNRNQAFRIK